jgi:hypothetical protein
LFSEIFYLVKLLMSTAKKYVLIEIQYSDLGFTEAPYRRNTGSELEDAGGSSLYKSTRHLLPLEHYEGGAVWARGGRPTPATIQVRAMLGDACGRDLDCGVTHSRCLKGGCVCKDAYAEAPDKQECLCKFNKNFNIDID